MDEKDITETREDITQEEETTETNEETTDISENSSDNSSSNEAADNEARLSRMEATLERVLGEISSLREAQGILVENGAVISDDTEIDFTDVDSFVPPSEMDLLI